MTPAPPVKNEYESSVNMQFFLTIVMAMIVGLAAAILLLPTWLPNLAASLAGTDPKVYWYLSRATAFISLSILWISMALGLGIPNKMVRLWPGAPAAFAIHEYVSLLGLALYFSVDRLDRRLCPWLHTSYNSIPRKKKTLKRKANCPLPAKAAFNGRPCTVQTVRSRCTGLLRLLGLL